ncbi:hypothetical protein P691DRAFT_786329 [Macrolepiota fuliginosa MF-IS2]|uniref:Uncharacterized protein n=1 Tax=Macrolepiota fuliginosa MF-IS2 TaxID=1400762 RepID=A0A9P5X6Q7_9AGAR|nr:hypothetical protein P691DRAFT_786329 [Macrolepiota fuliginosa MF-IS2]
MSAHASFTILLIPGVRKAGSCYMWSSPLLVGSGIAAHKELGANRHFYSLSKKYRGGKYFSVTGFLYCAGLYSNTHTNWRSAFVLLWKSIIRVTEVESIEARWHPQHQTCHQATRQQASDHSIQKDGEKDVFIDYDGDLSGGITGEDEFPDGRLRAWPVVFGVSMDNGNHGGHFIGSPWGIESSTSER